MQADVYTAFGTVRFARKKALRRTKSSRCAHHFPCLAPKQRTLRTPNQARCVHHLGIIPSARPRATHQGNKIQPYLCTAFGIVLPAMHITLRQPTKWSQMCAPQVLPTLPTLLRGSERKHSRSSEMCILLLVPLLR